MTTLTNALKKILYVHHGKGLGGAPLSLLYLIQNLDKSLYEPVVLFLHDSPAVELYQQHNIPIAGIVGRYDFSHTAIWWQRWYHAPMLAKITYDTIMTLHQDAPYWLNKIKPDIVHLNTSSLIAWGKAAHALTIPVVWHIREPLADGYLGIRKTIVRNYVHKYASAIVAISQNESIPWGNDPKSVVVYNAVDSQKFNPWIDSSSFEKQHFLTTGEPKILFLGGLSKEKGTLTILKAFKLLLKKLPTAKLLIAGYFDSTLLYSKQISASRKFYNQIKKYYEDSKQNIQLLGAIHDVPQAMKIANVLVFPASVGHFARPVIEAGFMQKPVIASALPPLNELVLDKQTGFLVSPQHIEEWAEKLYLLLNNPSLTKQLGENNYLFCKKHFDILHQIKAIENIYQKILFKKNNSLSKSVNSNGVL